MMTLVKHNEISGVPGWLAIIGDRLKRFSLFNFFLIIFIYHILVTFQGLDFNDEGFHLAFYQQIFNNPESVQYAFWGWLSGMLGGAFMKAFPFLGIWGIRLLGAIVSTGTIMVAYRLLKNFVHTGYLKLSIIMLSLFINEDAKNLYYNNLSAFLYITVAWFLFSGLRSGKNWLIWIAGFGVGLNIFARLPNLLGIGLVLAIAYFGFLTESGIKKTISRSLIFVTGATFAVLTVFIMMKWLHHFNYFVGSLKMIFSSSNHASQDDGLNGAYGIGRLLKNNLIDYAKSLRFVLIVAVLTGSIIYLQNTTRGKSRRIKILFQFCLYTLVVLGIYLLFSGWFTSYRLTEFFTGMSLLSVIVLFDEKMTSEYKLLTFIGLWILLVHPFGSSEGILTVVVYSMWLAFPISMDYCLRTNEEAKALGRHYSPGFRYLYSSVYTGLFPNIFLVLISLVSAGCLYNVIRYPYLCDRHQRSEMLYSVDNRLMKGVFTTKGRADAINDLLNASARYIKPGDYVLAYDCMPLYHYMTETKSYVRNPCIWFYTTGLFREEMNLAEMSGKNFPVIVRQLIKTTGEGSSWPEIKPAENYLAFKRTQGKNRILDEFIARNHYVEVWNNGEFEILIPQEK